MEVFLACFDKRAWRIEAEVADWKLEESRERGN